MLQNLVYYFEQISSLHRAMILAGGLCFFWILEGLIPRFHFNYHKWKHAGVNLFFTFTTILINFAFAVLIVRSCGWVSAHHWGLLQSVKMPLWLYLLAGLLLMDLVSAFSIHWIEHKIKWMWKFHIIHHADTHVDTTTANRHHPGESVFRAIFTLAGVCILGISFWLVMLYQSLSVTLTQFNHANIRLPRKLDLALSWFLVSPDMHKVHHHFRRPYTDSNFGNIFSVWDRLFGTYQGLPAEGLHYGLDVLPDPQTEHLGYQLGIPFDKTIPTDY
ncbi:MAG TPA: sterol desaturase family protein [Sediminibacterium sp.]|nr:sterol desaturase family protein [Sediminibacterium sp.]